MKISNDKTVHGVASSGASSEVDDSTQTVEESVLADEQTQIDATEEEATQSDETVQADPQSSDEQIGRGGAEEIEEEETARSASEPPLTDQESLDETAETTVEEEETELSSNESELILLGSQPVKLTALHQDTLDDEDPEEPVRKSFWPPTREQVITGVAFWAVIILGAALRFWALGDRPLHHDESLHAYYSLGLLRTTIYNWAACFSPDYAAACYSYDPLLHGPFQFHGIAIVYQISKWLNAPDNGVNTTTVRLLAATLGSAIVVLPFLVRKYLGTVGAWVACLLLAVSPSMVYYARFAREDVYMAFFTLLMVVCMARYMSGRQMKWLIWAAVAFALSYATKEATFLTIGIFGTFLGAVLAWELGAQLVLYEAVDEGSGQIAEPQPAAQRAARGASLASPGLWLQELFAGVSTRLTHPRKDVTASFIFLIIYFVTLGIIAKWFFGKLKETSEFVTNPINKAVSDAFVEQLKYNTMLVIPFLGIALGIFVLYKLWRELSSEEPATNNTHSLVSIINPQRQPWLRIFLGMPWTHWFFALICAWAIFVVLFTALFTTLRSGGIGAGIWQGLYYWLQQQQVARGGQPWYYYLLLIPLYEQIGVVFALVGIVRCLVQPTRFRLFLTYWFVGSFVIYSWAAEKMPWLTIHMTMPMMILAAIGLEPAARRLVDAAKWAMSKFAERRENAAGPGLVSSPPVRPGMPALIGSGLTIVLALMLLVPTLQNMYQVTYVHSADAGHEMMIYVQTSDDVKIVMSKIDSLDQKLYGGKHQLTIGVMDETTWPFAWYLRDYTNVCFQYTNPKAVCPWQTPDVVLTAGEQMFQAKEQFSNNYAYKQYRMRVQWDQGYMPPQCVPTPTSPCTDPQPYVGVGPLLWLTYGDTPPQKDAHFDIGRAANNIWQWWWQRKPIGDPNGSFDMYLMIRKDLNTQP